MQNLRLREERLILIALSSVSAVEPGRDVSLRPSPALGAWGTAVTRLASASTSFMKWAHIELYLKISRFGDICHYMGNFSLNYLVVSAFLKGTGGMVWDVTNRVSRDRWLCSDVIRRGGKVGVLPLLRSCYSRVVVRVTSGQGYTWPGPYPVLFTPKILTLDPQWVWLLVQEEVIS